MPAKEVSQWTNCSDKQRAKVPYINLALQDMANPCEVAKLFGVQLRQLRAFQIRDGATGLMVNDFAVARTNRAPRLEVGNLKPAKEVSQWTNCSDKQRAKVPYINLALQDMANPCEVAKLFGVQLRQLRAFQIRDGATGLMVNDFAVARTNRAPS